MNSFRSFFNEEGMSFNFKPLELKSQYPVELSQKPTVTRFGFCKDLSSGETLNGMFALHNTLLVFYGVKTTYINKLMNL